MTKEGDRYHALLHDDPDRARLLFRYLGGDEWREYRAILKVFAGTFFAEFTPEEVAGRVAVAGLDPEVIKDRLESLRRWGNLTVSSSVGSPTSLEDYYRRRHRYLITRVGQEVNDLVERVLEGAAEIGDVHASRLRRLHRALNELIDYVESGAGQTVGDDAAAAARSVFDHHEQFANELTQFFAQLNHWQTRYDLEAEEVQFFAGVLVNYVSEQLSEIERMVRPIARALKRLRPHVEALLPALRSGLAARVEQAGLDDHVAVRRARGTEPADWDHLAAWFIAADGRPARLDQLTGQALAAVRTLTANVSRLSRLGLGAVSRRADFVRLAGFFDRATTADEAHRIAASAFGLGSCRRLGTLAADADDPVPISTPWKGAPRAVVPVSLRERGEIHQRGNTTPIRDRRRERRVIEDRRKSELESRKIGAAELLASAGEDGSIDGATLSMPAFVLLRDLIGRSASRRRPGEDVRVTSDAGVVCEVQHIKPGSTTIMCQEGRLVLQELAVTVTAFDGRAERRSRAPATLTRTSPNPPVEWPNVVVR